MLNKYVHFNEVSLLGVCGDSELPEWDGKQALITSGTVQEFHLSSVPPQVCRRVTEAQAPKRTRQGQLRSLTGP